MRILIVEDDAHIRGNIRMLLTQNGCATAEASTEREAEALLRRGGIDLMLLDLGLPDGDGLTLIREVRRNGSLPIVVVSARETERDKVEALDAGADDYLTKPYGADELLARIRTALRHAGGSTANTRYTGGGLTVDLRQHSVRVDGREIHLTRTEYRILTLLCRNAGRVMPYSAILTEVWGEATADDTQLLRVNMANIRRKIERDPALPEFITTEIGIGYRMTGMDAE